jgi:hypothetical protein
LEIKAWRFKVQRFKVQRFRVQHRLWPRSSNQIEKETSVTGINLHELDLFDKIDGIFNFKTRCDPDGFAVFGRPGPWGEDQRYS